MTAIKFAIVMGLPLLLLLFVLTYLKKKQKKFIMVAKHLSWGDIFPLTFLMRFCV